MSVIQSETVREVRRACRHFAMLYFQFCRTMVDALGEENAYPLVQKTIFNLSLDRTDRTRQQALDQGLETNLENFQRVNDLPTVAWKKWVPEEGGMRCPYAQAWVEYYDDFPWFRRFASLYCDVIDTTNIENFSRSLSHKITHNLLWGDASCEREYFESDQVKKGVFTYGQREGDGAGA